MPAFAGSEEVFEDIAGADAGKLVAIADEDEAARRGERFEQRMEKHRIDHAHLIDDDQVRYEGIFAVSFKAAGSKSTSSKLWIVEAFRPVISLIRLPALPVGAAQMMFSVSFSVIAQDRLGDRALSGSGPPVMMWTFSWTALATASCC